MLHKRMFKVITSIDKHGGGKFWMRCGSAFINKDDSINVYLDAMPKNFEFQLRELTEDELTRKSTPNGDAHAGTKPVASDAVPF